MVKGLGPLLRQLGSGSLCELTGLLGGLGLLWFSFWGMYGVKKVEVPI